MAVRTGWRRGVGLSFLAVAVALLAGCGAPEYTYVTNSANRTYLKIPNSWRPIDAQELGSAIGLDPSAANTNPGLWVTGYDADATPSPLHLFGTATNTTAPAVFVSVQTVSEEGRGQMSLDRLRDSFFPVTPAARQQSTIAGLSDFALITDDVLTPGKGIRGVHTVYSYRVDGGPGQVLDQTAYINDDASKLYMLYLRCSIDCYEQRQQEIKNVVSSFTVREKP